MEAAGLQNAKAQQALAQAYQAYQQGNLAAETRRASVDSRQYTPEKQFVELQGAKAANRLIIPNAMSELALRAAQTGTEQERGATLGQLRGGYFNPKTNSFWQAPQARGMGGTPPATPYGMSGPPMGYQAPAGGATPAGGSAAPMTAAGGYAPSALSPMSTSALLEPGEKVVNVWRGTIKFPYVVGGSPTTGAPVPSALTSPGAGVGGSTGTSTGGGSSGPGNNTPAPQQQRSMPDFSLAQPSMPPPFAPQAPSQAAAPRRNPLAFGMDTRSLFRPASLSPTPMGTLPRSSITQSMPSSGASSFVQSILGGVNERPRAQPAPSAVGRSADAYSQWLGF
jgi:hypothetical protein